MSDTSPTIYLDHAATTPLDPKAAEAMMPFLLGSTQFGNPSSIHRYGRQAREAVDQSRDSVAALIAADYSEIFFTSGGTESDNLAIIGILTASEASRSHLIVSEIEHHAVLHSAHHLKTLGYKVSLVRPNSEGIITPESVSELMTEHTALVSIMHGNNEIGTLQPIEEIAAVAHSGGAKFHTDAVQTVGQCEVDVHRLGVDLLSLSAHKIYGPKGIGALFIKQGTRVSALVHGGAQEREKRAGTENVPGIVGFAAAARITCERRSSDAERIAILRDALIAGISELVPDVRVNGSTNHRLPNIVNVSVEGVDGTTLLMNLDRAGIAASSGSACSSGSIEPSHVLKAIGLSNSMAASGIRFSLGRRNNLSEIERCANIFAAIVARLRR